MNVNTLNRKGKIKRTRQIPGRRKDTKRALVTLHPDDKIEIFEGS
jgi:large subunit ribosomal protein L23